MRVRAWLAALGTTVCVRVLNEAMDFLWETDALAYRTPVWVY